MALEPGTIPVELKGISAMIDEYRTIPSLHMKSRWEIALNRQYVTGQVTGNQNRRPREDDDMIQLRSGIEFYTKNKKYRINQKYDPKVMSEMSYEIAYDGHHFQIFNRNSRRLNYSTKEQRDAMVLVLPNVLLEPLQFLGGMNNHELGFNVRWPMLSDRDVIHHRLAQAVVEEKVRKGRQVKMAFFPGGTFEGRNFRYRVVLDGPGGRPSRVDRITENGQLVTQSQFVYDMSKEENKPTLVREMRFAAFDEDLNLIMKSVVTVTELQISEDIPDNIFTFDFREANVVYDMDAGKPVKGLDAGRPQVELEVETRPTAPIQSR